MHLRDLTQFLSELSENNNRAWFVMNKPRYDILRAEFLELVVDLIAQISKFDPAIAACNPKRALFRINRDLRFGHDKRPYKTHFSASLTASGLKKPSQGGGPAYYFHIDADGRLLLAVGEYTPPPERLKTIRQHLIDDAKGFGKVLKSKSLIDTYGALQDGDKLVRPPKGFDADLPMIEFIKLRSFIVWKEGNLKRNQPASLSKELLTAFKDAYPLVTWLRQSMTAVIEE
ncbi:DUF2461 domain-containing protein [Herbaspirillum sp. RTI4]|uniref:DUF2461 domain-containing protein n=1 Tax=Herbaspirillum sp. RTI4 TaxID=3048640 RepID=UPI002AB467A6|nr:DUF2461 domain-containing protein [Herbaspirillum sp. RTI4]MDY7577760.1 DUF2461 domain-containing protein [Herbaspirillum sp. RTI4]MEA9980812.1 DUF2461 domain-containing protein [Herbaspirillum sp. RTI4]